MSKQKIIEAGYRIIGFDSVASIAPGASCVLIHRPQEPFKGERLHVEYLLARFFTIDCIRVGNYAPLYSSVPADTFSLQFPDGEEGKVVLPGESIDLPEAAALQDIALSVTNISPRARSFAACIIGRNPYAIFA